MRKSDKERVIKLLIVTLMLLTLIMCSCTRHTVDTLTEPNERDWVVVKVDDKYYWRENSKTSKVVRCKKKGVDYKVGTFLICPDYLRYTYVTP